MTIAQERSPDFFRLAKTHLPGLMETYVAEARGEVVGCGTYVLRDAWMPDGTRGRVGYVCDLRLRPAWRSARVLPMMGRVAFERARDEHGVHVFQAAVLDGNRRVVRTATSRSVARAGQPIARLMTPYHMVSVLFAGQRMRAEGDVEAARPEDLDDVVRFLAERQRARTFGYVVDRKLLETRLTEWPGLGVQDFLLARDRSGRLVGCAAPWNPHAVRRNRVLGYGGPMRLFRAAYGAYARLRGVEPLPVPGEAFRMAFLTHMEVEDDDPRVLGRLVAAAHARLRPARLHALAVMVPRASPMQRALRGPWAHRTPLSLHALQLEGGPFAKEDLATTRPGFEMALA